MNNDNFAGLKYFPDQRLNIRQIENIDTKSILRGNVKDLLAVLNDLAYVDVGNDDYVGGSEEAKNLYRLSQYGLQYMMYTVSKLGDNALLLKDYLQIQDDKRKKLLEVIAQQEETIKGLKQKKKALNETERQYQTLLKTMNIDTNVGRFASYDSEAERREDSIPINLPKGPKRNKSKEATKVPETTEKETNFGGQPTGYPIMGFQSFNNSQATQSNQSYPTPGFEGNRNLVESQRENRFNTPQQMTTSTYEIQPKDSVVVSNSSNVRSDEEGKNRREYMQQSGSTNPPIKIEDQKKTKEESNEDEYEDDFELSESYIPENNLKFPSRIGKSQRERAAAGSSDRKKDDQQLEETISIDFDKEFNKNYLENLDKLVNKNKPNVEIPVKRFS